MWKIQTEYYVEKYEARNMKVVSYKEKAEKRGIPKDYCEKLNDFIIFYDKLFIKKHRKKYICVYLDVNERIVDRMNVSPFIPFSPTPEQIRFYQNYMASNRRFSPTEKQKNEKKRKTKRQLIEIVSIDRRTNREISQLKIIKAGTKKYRQYIPNNAQYIIVYPIECIESNSLIYINEPDLEKIKGRNGRQYVIKGNDMVMIKKDQEKGNNQSQQEPLIGARPYIFQEVPRVPFENPYNNHSQRGPLIGAQPHISLTNYGIPTIQQPTSGRKSEISSNHYPHYTDIISQQESQGILTIPTIIEPVKNWEYYLNSDFKQQNVSGIIYTQTNENFGSATVSGVTQRSRAGSLEDSNCTIIDLTAYRKQR